MTELNGELSGGHDNFRNIIGVQFRRAGKIYDFLPGAMTLQVGDQVVVDTERGATVARVVKVDLKSSADIESLGVKTVIH
jgi:cell fate regulator YaaT (PSP1 superfamily)